MKVIGITGGVGCGKSTVANILKDRYNALLLLTDDIAKSTYDKGNEGYNRIIKTFGKEVLDEDGTLLRDRLAKLVFEQEEKLKLLNNLIHPIVWDRVVASIEKAKLENKAYVVIESAILVEAGYKKLCDEIWYIFSTEDVRIKRLMDTRGYSKQKCESIMNNQKNMDKYMEDCDIIINNNGDTLELEKEISRAINTI